MKVTCWLLLISALQLVQGHLVLTRERREVGPVTGPVTGGHKKYRRLQHSIMVQADIRSRSGQPSSKCIVYVFTVYIEVLTVVLPDSQVWTVCLYTCSK